MSAFCWQVKYHKIGGFNLSGLHFVIPAKIRNIPKPANKMVTGTGRGCLMRMNGIIAHRINRTPSPIKGPPLSTPKTGHALSPSPTPSAVLKTDLPVIPIRIRDLEFIINQYMVYNF
jgi:hypothetical protein